MFVSHHTPQQVEEHISRCSAQQGIEHIRTLKNRCSMTQGKSGLPKHAHTQSTTPTTGTWTPPACGRKQVMPTRKRGKDGRGTPGRRQQKHHHHQRQVSFHSLVSDRNRSADISANVTPPMNMTRTRRFRRAAPPPMASPRNPITPRKKNDNTSNAPHNEVWEDTQQHNPSKNRTEEDLHTRADNAWRQRLPVLLLLPG